MPGLLEGPTSTCVSSHGAGTRLVVCLLSGEGRKRRDAEKLYFGVFLSLIGLSSRALGSVSCCRAVVQLQLRWREAHDSQKHRVHVRDPLRIAGLRIFRYGFTLSTKISGDLRAARACEIRLSGKSRNSRSLLA